MSSDPDNTTMEKEAQNESQEHDPDTEELLDTILSDPRKKVALLLRIGSRKQKERKQTKRNVYRWLVVPVGTFLALPVPADAVSGLPGVSGARLSTLILAGHK